MIETGIFSLKLRTPRHLSSLPGWWGRAIQAWYLNSLRQVHPVLSAAVHDSNGIKPYTVSTLLVPDQGALRDFELQSATNPGIVMLQITTLHPDLTLLTRSLSETWLAQGITLHDHFFRVEAVDVQTDSYAGLVQAAAERPHPRRLRFEFFSPTVFKKTGGMQVPLPLPAYVFGSLYQRWKQFSPVPLCDDLEDYFEEHISIHSQRTQTQMISFERSNRGVYTGFRGRVEFFAESKSQPHFEQLHLLADFAAYSGVGSHTTVGLGRVRYG